MRTSATVRLVASLALLGLAVLLWGGYGRGWRWTGFGHDATLWDWLHVLALPLALALAPLWLRHRDRLDRRRQAVFAGAAAGFAILVALGYGLDLHWTGFPGNRLWDWLELLVLPLTVALLPVWTELSGGVRRRHIAVAACALAALGVAIVGGYGLHWRWTGFQGNTVFDWLQLFVAPLVLPVVLVPLAGNWMVAAVVEAGPAEHDTGSAPEPAPEIHSSQG
ncbi:MAG: hypothetical protein ACREBE_11275 [bacterium]